MNQVLRNFRTGPESERDEPLSRLRELLGNVSQLIETIHASGENVPEPRIKYGMDLKREVQNFEISLICQALLVCKGHQKRAAKVLGIRYSTLNQKIRKYNIDPDRYSSGPELAALA